MSYKVYICETNGKHYGFKCDMFSIGNNYLTLWLFNPKTDKKPTMAYQCSKLIIADVMILNIN